jgi:hypothetical protein
MASGTGSISLASRSTTPDALLVMARDPLSSSPAPLRDGAAILARSGGEVS